VERRVPALIPYTSAGEGTFFSQERFIQAVARAERCSNVRVLKIQSANSPACIFGLERIRNLNRRSVLLAPFGLPAYPIGYDWSHNGVSDFVGQLKTIRTVSFEWNVRFDHQDVATELTECGLPSVEDTTQVLFLDRPYHSLFRGFRRTVQQQIRRAERKGIVVRRTTDQDDLVAYYALYKKMIAERAEWNMVYKQALFEELLRLGDDVMLLLAELNRVVVAGGWFFRDGNSLFYWQCAMNYEFERYFPYYAIIDRGIQLACDDGMETFNMGASSKKPSIEQTKSFWGTKKVPYWIFAWQNPLWSSISRIRRRFLW
jgi:hypothetical protein